MTVYNRAVGVGRVRVFYFALLIVCVERLCVALLAHHSVSLHAALLSVTQPPADGFNFMTTNLLHLSVFQRNIPCCESYRKMSVVSQPMSNEVAITIEITGSKCHHER